MCYISINDFNIRRFVMFKIGKNLACAIKEKVQNSKIVLSEANVCYTDSCSCKGACGTYVPPCASCAYHD